MPTDIRKIDQSLSPGYVIAIVVWTFVMFFLYSFMPWIFAIATSGPIDWKDIFRTAIPAVEHSAMWNGKLCVPRMEVNPFNPGGMSHSLVVIDLQTRESRTIKAMIPPGPMKLVPDGDTLWCLSGSTVIKIKDDVVTPMGTGTTLSFVESGFLYEGKLAVIQENLVPSAVMGSTVSTYHLLVWSGTGWVDQGRVLLPQSIDEDLDFVVTPESIKDSVRDEMMQFGGPTTIHVLNVDGQPHIFCSDHDIVLHSSRLDLVPAGIASALAVENAATVLPGWDVVGHYSSFSVGSDSQGLLLLDHDVKFGKGPFNDQASLLRLKEGAWQSQADWKKPGFMLESQVVSDGKKAWTIGLKIGNSVSLTEIGGDSTDIKMEIGGGVTIEKLSEKVQANGWWVPYPVLAVYGLVASWLMARYRSGRYEFGNATVELASINRRTLAKLVDWLLVSLPILFVQWSMVGSPKQMQEWIMDKISNMDFQQLIRAGILLFLSGLLYNLVWLIALSVMEGRWGTSPGKWLLGIRVVRTTLRPCGFFRALVRELMSLPDFLICFGWVPGALCIAFTPCWQRMGDMVGDTIVIRKPGSGRFGASADAEDVEVAQADEPGSGGAGPE